VLPAARAAQGIGSQSSDTVAHGVLVGRAP
jgi:hypothetical protein